MMFGGAGIGAALGSLLASKAAMGTALGATALGGILGQSKDPKLRQIGGIGQTLGTVGLMGHGFMQDVGKNPIVATKAMGGGGMAKNAGMIGGNAMTVPGSMPNLGMIGNQGLDNLNLLTNSQFMQA